MPDPVTQTVFVVPEPTGEPALARLREVGRVLGPWPEDRNRWLTHLPEAHALLIHSKTRVTAQVLEQAPLLRVIGRAGVGLDHIDVDAARARGIEVVHTPEASTRAVAELTVGLLVAIQRSLLLADRAVRECRFAQGRIAFASKELGDQTLGIIGMGRIGRHVARICHVGLGMKILFNDIISIGELGFPADSVEKDTLLTHSDVISLHVPLTVQTRGLINGQTLARMKPGAWLINTARGAVVDARAVAEALESGRLAGAAMDVFDPEPPPADHPLLTAPNCLLTPHTGSRTQRAMNAMEDVVEDIIAVLSGRPARHPAPANPARR